MKSAIGIGSLLADGLGDTVRVSLTEDPEFELKPCSALIKIGEEYTGQNKDRNLFLHYQDLLLLILDFEVL